MTTTQKIIILFFVLGSSFSFSQTKMPSFFSNDMILQQQNKVSFWGTDAPNVVVKIETSWGEKSEATTDSDGNWATKITTISASFQKHTITVNGTTNIKLENVLMGEVWFCSGQSNMEIKLGDPKNPVNNAKELISTSLNSNIRLFNAKKSASLILEDNVVGEWQEASPDALKNFSAIGYGFGRTLFEKLNVPVGIIVSAWGGSSIECWIPKLAIEKYPKIKVPDTLSVDINKQKRPTFLYNGMINPFKNFAVKGFLWYQGEANQSNPKPYKDYMTTLVSSWRNQWQNDNLPFYFVEIAPYDYEKKNKTPSIMSNLLREAQRIAAHEIPNSGIVITTDVGKCNFIHPPEKYSIAKRLANWALGKQYNIKKIAYHSPEYKSLEIKNNQAILTFSFFDENKDNQIFDSKRELKSFEIAGEDKIFYPAKVAIHQKKQLIVQSDKVTNPVAVRYGFESCLEGSLFSKAGLPISSFRTDNWNE